MIKEKLVLPNHFDKLLVFGLLTYLTQFCFPRATKRRAIEERGPFCEECNRTGVELAAHHILPESFGGSHDIRNLSLLCKKCHKMYDDQALNEGVLYTGMLASEVLEYRPELVADPEKLNEKLLELTQPRNEKKEIEQIEDMDAMAKILDLAIGKF